MGEACSEADERARLRELARLQIGGAASEAPLDTIVRLAATMFAAPIAYISAIDSHTQSVKACVGMEPADTPRETSFCDYTIRSDAIFVVPDARQDVRFRDRPMVREAPHVRFYAGAPLITAAGRRVGALCVADVVPRDTFSDHERRLLGDLAALAVEQLELRRTEFARTSIMAFADATALSLIALDPSGRIEFANRSASALFGYPAGGMVGKELDVIIPERMRAGHHAGLAQVFAGGESKLSGKTLETTALRADGSEFPIELSLSVWRIKRGVGVGATIRDISERRDRDARLLRLANHDPLTGLCNRRNFEHLLEERFAREQPAAVLLLDLDGFKEVNDSLGHGVGDTLLQAVAIRLPAALPADSVVARFGGDEFAVLLPSGDPLRAHECARGILSVFEAPFEIDGHILQLAVSVGYSVLPGHGQDPEELIASADFALYRAKKSGGSASCMFSAEMRSASTARRATQDELLRALQKGELELHYQPQVNLDDGRLVSAEALLRWRHPVRGLLLPNAFMAALESSSLTLPVGWWVLDEACRQIAAWRAAGVPAFRVGVNLFPAQYRAASLLRQVTQTLARHEVSPDLLELEMTETIVMQNDDLALATVRELRERGVGIAFDDFGTGYASLSTLRRFPLTTLKIDRSFVQDLWTSPTDAAITRAMLAMGRDLGLETIAEGVETKDQEEALRMLGCRMGQGFRYARAMPADAMAAFALRDAAAAQAAVVLDAAAS